MYERCTTYSDRSSHLTISNRSRQFELLDSFEYSDRIDYSYLRTEYSTVEMVIGFLGHPEVGKRTCWWNEVCKEEFHSKFRCRCPRWSYCRAPGRYYDAHCSITRTGYIWTQPETSLTLEVNK
ncbi:uncharacterized protein LOC100747346 isoform X1 [Bombus impatiens]|uniref:Uncharacterized protein LOC100747346 isoform X1 n=1 Tax=Bombus impatiens TaxID=132113 RepID=A0A6P8LY84_BOMIM|nr:uncharacterized protein LOC100747346 isoform X1 [Bombus impatiens]